MENSKLKKLEVQFISFDIDCMQMANRFWLDMENWKLFDVELVININNINGRAIVPKYSRCNHPHINPKNTSEKKIFPQDILVYKGNVYGVMYALTGNQFALSEKHLTSSSHKKCFCYNNSL